MADQRKRPVEPAAKGLLIRRRSAAAGKEIHGVEKTRKVALAVSWMNVVVETPDWSLDRPGQLREGHDARQIPSDGVTLGIAQSSGAEHVEAVVESLPPTRGVSGHVEQGPQPPCGGLPLPATHSFLEPCVERFGQRGVPVERLDDPIQSFRRRRADVCLVNDVAQPVEGPKQSDWPERLRGRVDVGRVRQEPSEFGRLTIERCQVLANAKATNHERESPLSGFRYRELPGLRRAITHLQLRPAQSISGLDLPRVPGPELTH
jgi:hypothetical protein